MKQKKQLNQDLSFGDGVKNKLLIEFVFILLLFIIFIPYSLAISNETAEIQNILKIAEKDMEEMINDGIAVTRYNDTLISAKKIYEAQLTLERAGGKPDYSLVYEKLDELKNIKKNAYKALDELKALELTINQTKGIDLSPVLEIYQEAKGEFRAERYERCLELTDKAYNKISELEAWQTKVKVFYEATSRSILTFLKENWKEISITLIVIFTTIVLSYNRVMCWRINKKIESLKRRRESIEKLIAKTQREYFEKGKISETAYHIRIKKYSEMIRDINRQIPLLKEELSIRRKRKI